MRMWSGLLPGPEQEEDPVGKQGARAVCGGYGPVGLHAAEPGEKLVGALCAACREAKEAAK